jgi:hypothetical protein
MELEVALNSVFDPPAGHTAESNEATASVSAVSTTESSGNEIVRSTSIAMAAHTGIAPIGMKKQYYVITRPMEPKKRIKDRQWKHRPKVSSRLSKDFPWEVVLRFLKDHARSLIILQMVDKNLNNLISIDNKLWLYIFNREIKNTAYCIRTIKDPIYPTMRLWKSHLHGLPVYLGPLRGDSDDACLGFAFDACFSSYVRRVYALKHGTKCGICGCRYRHEVYWSLRMRVCRLCMEGNTISGEALSRKYGVDYSDMLINHKGKFFFYTGNVTGSDDRVSVNHMTSAELNVRNTTYMFWLPHLRTFLDLPALCQKQKDRRNAAVVLSNAVKRRWTTFQRNIFGTKKSNYSVDCLVIALYRNEKKRFTHPYGVTVPVGGPSWSFPDCTTKYGRPNKFIARNGENLSFFYRLLGDFEDCVV